MPNLKVIRLLIGGRGPIPKLFQDFWKEQNVNISSYDEVSTKITVQNSF